MTWSRTRTAPPWSQSEDAALRRLWAQGTALKEIAHQIGRSESATERRRRTLELPRRRAWHNQAPDHPRRINVLIDEETYRRLSARAHGRRCSLSVLVRLILKAHA